MSIRTIAAGLAVFLLAGPLDAQQRSPLPEKDRPITLATRTLFSVGAVEGKDYETFAGVTDVAFDADGRLYILEATAHRVLVFDAGGRHVRTIGRQGDGPGEFGLPTALAILPNGELVVNDAGRAALQVFSRDGEYLRSAPVSEELGRAVGRMRSAPGGIITETMNMRSLLGGGERTNLQRLQLPPRSVTWLTVGETAEGRRLYNAPPRESRMSTTAEVGGSGGARFTMSINAFEPSLLWTPLPGGGVAAMHGPEYRIAITAADGSQLRYLDRPIEPRKVTETDRKRFLENRRNGVVPGGGSGAVIMFGTSSGGAGAAGASVRSGAAPGIRLGASDIKESDVNWADVIPVVRALGTDSFGRLWVQRNAPDQGDGPIDLIGTDFRYLGTLAPQPMPRAFGPGGRLAYIEKDELDVQRVVVKQITSQ